MSESVDINVERAAKLDTATLSDALDRKGLIGQCHQVLPRSTKFRMSGRAWTVKYGPVGHPAGTVGDYIDEVKAGDVVVLDNGGRTDATVWGDILTELAHRKQIAGTVIDGVNRDVALCVDLEYPVYSKGSWMRTGKDRVQVEGTQIPVSIGGVRVCPGDLVRGDADGVVVIPRQFEDEVLRLAEEIHEAEEGIRNHVRSGVSLTEARARFKYHSLQTREKA